MWKDEIVEGKSSQNLSSSAVSNQINRCIRPPNSLLGRVNPKLVNCLTGSFSGKRRESVAQAFAPLTNTNRMIAQIAIAPTRNPVSELSRDRTTKKLYDRTVHLPS